MTPERYGRLLAHFDLACDLDGAGRAHILSRLRVEDAELAEVLAALLDRDRDKDRPPTQTEKDPPDTVADPEAIPAAPAAAHEPAAPGKGSELDRAVVGAVIAGRYRVDQPLGSGGAGAVYRAWDLQGGGDVAIKFLRTAEAEEGGPVLRFRREFRAVARLNHPGCLKVFCEGAHGALRYIVMEYVAGGDLQRLVGAETGLLLAVLIRLCAALEYIHGLRIVHRDLKPANVLLAPGDPVTPKLADFGIAKVFTESVAQLSRTGVILGTLDYISPEQVRGRPVDPRSDLYSLGCMIYRLFARRVPFLGGPYERMMARVFGQAPPLHELCPTVPPGLSALALRLLAPDPERRPQSAFAVGQELTEILVQRGGALPAQLLVPAPRGTFLYRAGLLGREEPLTRCLSLLRAMHSGAPGAPAVIALCGEPGIGKSALATAVGRQIQAGGARLHTAPLPESGASPLAPFPALLSLLDRTGAAPRPAELTPPPSPGSGRPIIDGVAARRRHAAALAARLREAHSRDPLVLLLEDLHNAEQGALELLGELLPLLSPGPRPAWLVTLRPGGREALRAALHDRAAVVFVDVAPLDARAAAAVACAMLGVSEARLPPLLGEILMRESEGNPLLLQSALRALVDRGALVRGPAGWDLEPDGPGQAAVDRALSARLSRLLPETRQVLAVAAAAGEVFDTELVRRAAGLEEDVVLDALDEALRASIIRARSQAEGEPGSGLDRYEFEHARLRDAVYASVPAEAQQAAHRGLAAALRDRGSPPSLLAHHAERAGDAVPAYHALRAAAAEAAAAYDPAAALRHLQAAHALAPQLPERMQLLAREECLEAQADALQVLGRAGETTALLSGLLRDQTRSLALQRPPSSSSAPQDERGLVRARRLRKLGQARQRAGDTAGALAALEQALLGLGVEAPRGRTGLLLHIARDVVMVLARHLLRLRPRPDAALWEQAQVHRELSLLYRWIDDERSAAHHFACARAAARHGAPELLVEAYAAVATFLAFIASARMGGWVEAQARRLALAVNDRMGLARILLWRGGADVFLRDDPADGLARLDEGVKEMGELGDRVLHAWSVAWRGWAGIMAGRFAQAREDFQRAAASAAELNVDWLRTDATCGRMMTDLAFGHFNECQAAAREVLASDVRLALPALEVVTIEILGGHAFMTGRFRAAAERFARARDLYRAHHLDRGWGFLVHIEHAEALLCQVAQEGAAAVPDLVQQLREDLELATRRLGQLPFYRGSALVLEGIYHSRRGAGARARRLFDRALAARPPPRQTYMDLWMLWRIAFERRYLGDAPTAVSPLLDEVEGIIAMLGLRGMEGWLALARRLHGL